MNWGKRSYAIPAILAVLLVVGGALTAFGAYQSVRIDRLDVNNSRLSVDEEAYYEYVVPRLDRLVTEVDDVVTLVDTRSRDIMSLSRSGTVIEQLTGEIRTYGEEHGVPSRFAEIHGQILTASDTVNATFAEARTALRTFNFSQMSGLVPGFHDAAESFTAARDELKTFGSE